MTCPNCGGDAAHFVPPCFGDEGFYSCQAKPRPMVDDLLERADAYMVRRHHDLVADLIARVRAQQVQIDNLAACYASVSASSRALREMINALTYCPYCGQGHAMHTAGCKILAGMLACAMAEAPK